MLQANQSAARTLALAGRTGPSSNSKPKTTSYSGRGPPNPFTKFNVPDVRRIYVNAATTECETQNETPINEITRLREENAALRAALEDRIDTMDVADRETFYSRHADIILRAREAGETIPALDGAPDVSTISFKPSKEKEQEQEDKKHEITEVVVEKNEIVPTINQPGVVVEIEKNDTLVFKFGDISTPSHAPISNSGGKSSSMSSSNGMPRQRRRSSRPSSSKQSGSSSSPNNDDAIVFTFENNSSLSVVGQGTSASSKANNVDDGKDDGKDDGVEPPPSSGVPLSPSGKEEQQQPRVTTTKTNSRSGITTTTNTTKPSSTRSPSTLKSSGTRTKSSSAKKTTVDPHAASRAAATSEAESHDPVAALADKEYWLYATVPSTPVAGALCTLYFNRAQSEILRHRPRIQLQARFNNWELEPSGDTPDRLDMIPAEGVPRADGTDFYRVSFTVPADAYEFNFIFSDGEGMYDNNNSLNYVMPVDGPMTRDLWIDGAPERAEAIYLARKEAERVAAEKAAAEREAAALEDDKRRAQQTIAELKQCYLSWQDGAVKDGDELWATSPSPLIPGRNATFYYNRLKGPLASIPIPEDQHLVLKVGYNGWKASVDVVLHRVETQETSSSPLPAPVLKSRTDSEWWKGEYTVPRTAAALNFVIQYYEHFDNNRGADFKAIVNIPSSAATSVESWADSMSDAILCDITATRHAEEKAAAAREAAKEAARQAVRAKAEEVRRKQMRHVLFTEPASPVAGNQVTISYNPNNTNLHGAERVYIRGGYNRWRHPKSFGPLEMTAPATADGQHFSITISVPKDAYSLDFVFSDAEEYGQYDNRGGLDYHMPVEGSVVSEPPMYVVHVAAEMAPIAKVGGLGDVVTALGRAVQDVGHQVEVILPRYDFFLQSPLLGATRYETEFDWAGIRIFVSSCIVEGLRCWFIEPANGMFATSTVYQGATDAARFNFFSRAALEFLLRTQRQPDIIHCHDWSSAEVAKAYWNEYHHYGLWHPKVVFTIHNLNYGATAIGDAAYYSQRFTTVSPTYAWEIGGHPAVAPHSSKLLGIRNGIDVDIWNPETDQFLPMGYNADTADRGKAAAREELRRRLGLTGWGDKPLVGVVTRLTKQKGTHLIAHSVFRTIDRGGQFVLLGSAPDPKVQAEFDGLAAQYGGENAAFCFAFDEPLSHLIYAACDLILVPSMFEPCGLTQMIAMRYGAIPVVRATGGLKDTVFDVDTDKGRAAWELEGSTDWMGDHVDATNGFAFEGTDAGALDYALNRALDAWYNDRTWFRSLQQRVMRQDWSWNKPAIDYIQLYYAAMK